MRPAIFSQERIDSFPKREARPDARAGWIARNDGEPLIDFLKRIVIKEYNTFEFRLIRAMERSTTAIIQKAAVDEYLEKIDRAENIDPVMIDADTGKIINGNTRMEAYRQRASINVPAIFCSKV